MRLAVGGNPAVLRSLGTAAVFRLCSFSLIAHSVGNGDKNGTVTEMFEHLTLAFGVVTLKQYSPNLSSARVQKRSTIYVWVNAMKCAVACWHGQACLLGRQTVGQ